MGVKNAAIVKKTNSQKKTFSLTSCINLFRYWVENKSAVLCKMKVEKEKTIAIEAPIIPATANAKLCRLSLLTVIFSQIKAL